MTLSALNFSSVAEILHKETTIGEGTGGAYVYLLFAIFHEDRRAAVPERSMPRAHPLTGLDSCREWFPIEDVSRFVLVSAALSLVEVSGAYNNRSKDLFFWFLHGNPST